MPNTRKLSAFRQLSLSCETPTHENRRKSLKKQFSEDIPDVKNAWLDSGMCIKMDLNSKGKKLLDKPPPVKIAWEEHTKNFKTEDAVIVKKCTEVKRPATSKLVKHSSLENDSILYTKSKLTDILPTAPQEPEKPNINIFLAYNSKETNASNVSKPVTDEQDYYNHQPKIMSPLFCGDNKKVIQIRKNPKPKINLNEIAYSPTRTNDKEKIKRTDILVTHNENENNTKMNEDIKVTVNLDSETVEPKAINNVIIRPITAADKREKFQKRTNSAFTSISKESPSTRRPPLVRSTSAPCKPDQAKSKFVATKRKIKSAKRTQFKPKTVFDEDSDKSTEDSPKDQKVNKTVTIGSDIVTMVSLVSPDGSDEEEVVEEVKEKEKEKEKVKPIISSNKNSKENELVKNMSLRKTVKSVSFQQSSIHAIRSFSASFPGRRGSVATSLMLNKSSQSVPKNNEKRATNSTMPDDDERMAKRRLVRSLIEKTDTTRSDEDSKLTTSISESETELNISVDIKTKEHPTDSVSAENTDFTSEVIDPCQSSTEEIVDDDSPKFESTKEKQCWDMYCKMSEKGINVSYDTILRGMLTPTEYRMRRKESITATFDNC